MTDVLRPRVLVTGGAGYIGSHCVVSFLQQGWDAVVIDDLSNGHPGAVHAAARLGGRDVELIVGDVGDLRLLHNVLSRRRFDAVAHFAALKSVPDSVARPEAYWRVNVGGTATLCEAMRAAGVRRLVYSSSASVYGTPDHSPIDEDAELRPESPYGRTKALCEELLSDFVAKGGWSVTALRYFNPVGAHPSAKLGEHARRLENLVPLVLESAAGRKGPIVIAGTDYPTPDGTAIRDYVHISDLAEVHASALEYTGRVSSGMFVCNVGTGRGTSVREVVDAARRVTGIDIPAVDGPRRPGDPAAVWADTARAREELGWSSRFSLEDMIASAWAWRTSHPHGYSTI
jgi:UDP-glucose 4-epimerase